MMKNKIYTQSVTWMMGAMMMLFLLSSCSPQELNKYELESTPAISSELISFTAEPSAKSPNIITFTNTTKYPNPVTIVWDLGNGASSGAMVAQGQYPRKGDYTVTLTLYAANGTSASVSKVVSIAEDDFGLIDTEMYRNLTGGIDNLEGKTWVFDQYHGGHFGVGPAGAASPEWWSADAGAKEGSSLYTQKFTFYQDGTRLKWENNGYIYTNGAGVSGLGNPAGVIDNPGGVGDFDVPYEPKESYTFILDEEAGTLTLSDGAFFGHYAGASEYKIISLTETELYVSTASTVEVGNGWWYRLIPEELNVEEPEVPKVPEARPLSEDFEGEERSIEWVPETMGDKSGVVDNPYPFPINESDKVYRYHKGEAFYTNLSYVASDYKFDLTAQNKVRVDVFIPSFNDYHTEHSVAGEWITEKRLRPQLAIKLQNSDMGGNAWQTQAEIIQGDLPMDKWITLEFDFSAQAEREDFDKIVIQFGQEGHAGPGIFFFDNFRFEE